MAGADRIELELRALQEPGRAPRKRLDQPRVVDRAVADVVGVRAVDDRAAGVEDVDGQDAQTARVALDDPRETPALARVFEIDLAPGARQRLEEVAKDRAIERRCHVLGVEASFLGQAVLEIAREHPRGGEREQDDHDQARDREVAQEVEGPQGTNRSAVASIRYRASPDATSTASTPRPALPASSLVIPTRPARSGQARRSRRTSSTLRLR